MTQREETRAQKAWAYMKDRISAILRGMPVRDLDEAMVEMDSALATQEPARMVLDLTKLMDAIEDGDDAYNTSKIHGQAFWKDCIEARLLAALRPQLPTVEIITETKETR